MNIRLDKLSTLSWKITVNNWSIQKKQRERRSRYIKKNGNGVPVRSRPTRTLIPNGPFHQFKFINVNQSMSRDQSFFVLTDEIAFS